MTFKDIKELISILKKHHIQYTNKFKLTKDDNNKVIKTVCSYCEEREKREKDDENGFVMKQGQGIWKGMNNDSKAKHLFNDHSPEISVEIAAIEARKAPSQKKAMQKIDQFCSVTRHSVQSIIHFKIENGKRKKFQCQDQILKKLEQLR